MPMYRQSINELKHWIEFRDHNSNHSSKQKALEPKDKIIQVSDVRVLVTHNWHQQHNYAMAEMTRDSKKVI